MKAGSGFLPALCFLLGQWWSCSSPQSVREFVNAKCNLSSIFQYPLLYGPPPFTHVMRGGSLADNRAAKLKA